jgi:hypothetical protein
MKNLDLSKYSTKDLENMAQGMTANAMRTEICTEIVKRQKKDKDKNSDSNKKSSQSSNSNPFLKK